jgi:ubiquinone/menaquinone biosynthesis C-methylase UbiE
MGLEAGAHRGELVGKGDRFQGDLATDGEGARLRENAEMRSADTAGQDDLDGRTNARGWLLNEVASAGRENLDVDHVRSYDDKEDATAADEVRYLCARGLGEGSVVVDIGAGTGQFALAAASVCERVVVVDVSPVMLDLLRTKLLAAPASNVDVVQAGFLSYEHRGGPADLVYSRYALHHLPDFWKALALRRIRRMLRPGGMLRLWDVVYSFAPEEAEERIEAWCASAAGDGAGSWSRAELEEHVRDEHSTFTWLLEPMLHRAGFALDEASYSADGIFATYLARAT